LAISDTTASRPAVFTWTGSNGIMTVVLLRLAHLAATKADRVPEEGRRLARKTSTREDRISVGRRR
jgi:hypothetical protein